MADPNADALRALEVTINELRAIEADFPASYAAALLFVALYAVRHPDTLPTISEIADQTGISRPTMSRIVLSMSSRRLGRRSADEPTPDGARKALGLFERVPDDYDLRVMRVKLTTKGKALCTRLAASISKR